MAFSHNEKTKLVAGAVWNEIPYTKKAKSYMSNGELKGKKYGGHYKIYIADPGHASEGIKFKDGEIDEINEIEVDVVLKNIKTGVTLDSWNDLNDIEDFTKEVAQVKGRMLARTLEQKVIESTVFTAQQAIVGAPTFANATDAVALLDELSVDGDKVLFVNPTVGGKIGSSSLGAIHMDDVQKDIYRNRYLGKIGTAAEVEEPLMPTVDFTGASAAVVALPALTPISTIDSQGSAVVTGYEGFNSIGAGLTPGWAFTVAGLKLKDLNGIATEQDLVLIVGADGKIPEVRIDVIGAKDTATGADLKPQGKNANAWVDASFDPSTATVAVLQDNGQPMTGKYRVAQVRDEQALAFDTYEFNKISGTDSARESFENITVEFVTGGDVKNRENTTRLDIPYAAEIPEARRVALWYVK